MFVYFEFNLRIDFVYWHNAYVLFLLSGSVFHTIVICIDSVRKIPYEHGPLTVVVYFVFNIRSSFVCSYSGNVCWFYVVVLLSPQLLYRCVDSLIKKGLSLFTKWFCVLFHSRNTHYQHGDLTVVVYFVFNLRSSGFLCLHSGYVFYVVVMYPTRWLCMLLYEG